MSILYIHNLRKSVKLETDEEVYTYYLNTGDVSGPRNVNLNDNKRLNEIALEIRGKYSDFIYSLNNIFIKNNLILDKKLSLYFISDLSVKRTELFDTYVSICHILLLKEKLKGVSFEKIVTLGCSEKFIESLKSVFCYKGIECRQTISSVRYNFLRNYIFSAYFFLDAFMKRIFLGLIRYHNIMRGEVKRLFFTIFPLHLNEEGGEQKYGSLVKDTDAYLVSIITDGMHQWRTLMQYQKDIRILKKLQTVRKIILLDKEVTPREIVMGYFNMISLGRKKKILRKSKYVFCNINITKFIQYEIDISFKRIPRLLMYKNALRRIFNNSDIERFYYYLHEYSFGRFLSFSLGSYFPEIKRIGFQHGPASWRKLLYALAQGETSDDRDYLNHVPMPNMVLCEDDLSKEIYTSSGYHNVETMKEVPRLCYLKDIKREKVRENTVLIACGLHDGPLIFAALKNEIISNKRKKYIIKFHPKTNLRTTINEIQTLNLENLEIGYNHISHYLNFVSEVISSYSSVGYEAYLLGIKSRVLKLNNKINESPILDLMS